MTLDPDIKKLLERINAIEDVDLERIDASQFRQMVDAADLSMRLEKIEVTEARDMKIRTEAAELRTRLYTDSGANDSLILYFHGGGFIFGNLDTHDSICRLMAKISGCKVLSVDYRLAPEHKFPAAVMDAYGSYTWTLNNHSDLGIDRNRIALSGDSAGGNLSAVTSMMARNDGIQIPKIQVLFYPVVGIDYSSPSEREFSEGYFLNRKMSSWFMSQYMSSPSDLLDPRFSILGAEDLSNLPETVVFTGEYDPLRDQGETFVSKLNANGTKATGIRGLGMVHGFISFFEYSNAARNLLIMGSELLGHALRK